MKKYKIDPLQIHSVLLRELRVSVVNFIFFHHRGTENTEIHGEHISDKDGPSFRNFSPFILPSVLHRELRVSVVNFIFFHHRDTENTEFHGVKWSRIGRFNINNSSFNIRYSIVPLTHKLIPNAR